MDKTIDYSVYAGKVIECEWFSDSGLSVITKTRVKVSGCDFDIGLTLWDSKTNEYRLCMWNPELSEKVFGFSNGGRAFALYEEIFKLIVADIKKGKISADTIEKVIASYQYKREGDITQENCPFGQ